MGVIYIPSEFDINVYESYTRDTRLTPIPRTARYAEDLSSCCHYFSVQRRIEYTIELPLATYDLIRFYF